MGTEPGETQESLSPYGYRCYWCLAFQPDHVPAKCAQRTMPDMSDFEQRKPKATRGAAAASAAKRKSKARVQTTRSDVEQREHSTKRRTAHKTRTRELEQAAKARATEFHARYSEPITGVGPFGQYTLAQLLCIEFAKKLTTQLSEETLGRDHASINASAVQKMAALVKANKAFPSMQSLRLAGEPAVSDFVTLHMRVQAAGDEVDQLLSAAKAQERARHPSCAAVKALPANASLLQIVREASLASAPKRGRPSEDAQEVAEGEMSMARNWVDGGYTVESMHKRARHDTRRVNVAQTSTQRDVLEGTDLIINGAPTSVEELRMYKPSKRRVQICHATTARLHAAQLNEWHSRRAAKLVRFPFPQWDEGTAGGFSTGVPGLVAGVSGLLPDGDGKLTEPYNDMLGLVLLQMKTGLTVAAAMMRLLKRRSFEEFYFCGTDAVNSNVGHATGAIAYFRKEYDQLLIFAIRCLGHISSRTLRHMLTKVGSMAGRPGLKRRAEEPNVDREVLLMEDVCHCFKKWPMLRQEALKLQPEPCPPIRGCIDTRFQWTTHAMQQKLGLTLVLWRQEKLWLKAVLPEGAPGLKAKAASELDAEARASFNGVLSLAKVKAAIASDVWSKDNYDFSDHEGSMISFQGMVGAYTGSCILPQFDLLISKLNPDRISFDELKEEGYTLAAPAGCTLPADSGKLPEKIPRFLLDLGDLRLRLDCAISETIGDRFFSGHLNFVEKRHFGIFFEAHDEIELHRDVCSLFGDEDKPWGVDDVADLKPSFARGLGFLEKYAMQLEDSFEGMVEFVYKRVDAKMSAYSDYYHDQTEEWFSNPAFVIGRLGSKKSGSKAAKWLIDEGKVELIAAVADVLHCSSADVRTALLKENYHGPLRLLVDDELWAELASFAHANESLWDYRSAPKLRELVRSHYTPLRIANVWMEELVKAFKNLTPQARAHPEGAEVRLCLNARTEPSQFGLPTMEEIKEIRRDLGHHLPSRLRPPRLPPIKEDEIEAMFWEGAEPEEGFDSDHEEEEERGEEEDDDGGSTEAHAGAASEVDDDGTDDEGEPDADETDEQVLQQLREQAQPIKDRARLAKDRGFLCWDNKEKTSFFPIVLTEDWSKGMVKIKCACLEKKGASSLYTIDPRYKGDTNKSADKAYINLIFEVPGEGLREVEGGIETTEGPEKAWKMQPVTRQ